MWFIGGEVEQETSAPPSKKNPGSASATGFHLKVFSRILEKYSSRKASLYYVSPETLVQLFLLEKV